MENERVKLIMETMWNTEWQGAQRDTGLLHSAILSLCAVGKISKEEAVFAREMLEPELGSMGKELKTSVFLTVTPEIADDTVLWMRNSALEAEEPYAAVIQQAAEYLHDFWAELIQALPAEVEKEQS